MHHVPSLSYFAGLIKLATITLCMTSVAARTLIDSKTNAVAMPINAATITRTLLVAAPEVCVMFDGYAFFPQLFPGGPGHFMPWRTAQTTTPQYLWAEDAYNYVRARPSLNVFAVSSWRDTKMESTDTENEYYFSEKYSAAAPGSLLDDTGYERHSRTGEVHQRLTPPPCEGSYIQITTQGPLPLYPLGCFADLEVPKELMLASDPTWYVDRDFSSSHAFPYVLPDYSSMTIEKCAALASKAGSPYFGVEKGAECWFGNSVTNLVTQMKRYGQVDNSTCNTPCLGAPNETCGGSHFFNLYLIPQVASDDNPAYRSGWQ
ncbi:MAG: hypothetical protein WDW38_006808 [Sanguina aurantia]